jgi:hypothetical protein
MVNVNPSAFGLVNWNVNVFVKLCTFTGVVQNALAAWLVDVVSVSCNLVPFSLVCPLSCSPPAVKPVPKLTVGFPPLWATVSVTCEVCVNAPLVALTVTVFEPTGVDPVVEMVIVDAPEPVIEVGLNEAVAPAGNPIALSATVPLKPLVAVTVAV